MKRTVLAILILLALLLSTAPAKPKKKKVPCQPDLAHCGDEGCGTKFDPNLNRLKNIRAGAPAVGGSATKRTLAWIKKLDDPESFEDGESREELSDLGEGQKVVVVAYLLVAKPELGGESCNCGLQTVAETDNHLVLVTKTTVDKFPIPKTAKTKKALDSVFRKREPESITAEFTPRVRLDHPNFTREKIQPLINKTRQRALLVRVTGLLLFDSEHFIRNHLVRVNNWEIHPVLKIETCKTGNKCKSNSDAGWESLDDQ